MLPEPYYQDELVTLFHGDCREIVPQLGKFDLLLTDPPYGIRADKEASKNEGRWGWKFYGHTDWDNCRPPASCFHLMLEQTAEQIVWGGNYFTDILPPSMRWLVWDKGQRDFSLADVEFAWTSRHKASRVFDYARSKAVQDGKFHPTQKPVALIRWCIELEPDAETVLDPFAGVGTTGIAAKLEGRKCTMIEKEKKYCEIAANRLRQKVMF